MKSTIEITEKELRTLYEEKALSINQVAKQFNTTPKVINRFFKNYGIEKDSQRQFIGKDGIYKAILRNYSQEAVFDLYIKQNKSNEDLQKLWQCKEGTVSKVLAHYNIHKDKARANEIAFQKKFEKWGSEEEYNKYLKEKTTETIVEKYGSITAYNQMKSQKSKDVWIEKTPEEIKARTEKINKTCQEKYGVEFFCQAEECKSVSGNNSKPNKDFEAILTGLKINFEREFPLQRFSYDFKINNILIEINPTYTHNSSVGIFNRDPLNMYYHQNKTVKAVSAGYRCIHVFDWDDKYKVAQLLLPRETIYARHCEISLVSLDDARNFLTKYQGYVKADIRIGLFYDGELVSLMTFDKPRYNRNYEYELIRYCSSKNIIGGAEKLFSYFVREYKPKSIISYCDLAKFSGEVYSKLGFVVKQNKPSKHWYNPKTKQHFTDNLLRQQGFSRLIHKCDAKDDNLDSDNNHLLMLEAGFFEIYDAGQATCTLTFEK